MPRYADLSLPIEERVADAEARGEWDAVVQLQAQRIADDMVQARDETVTLVMTNADGTTTDIRDVIQGFTIEARNARDEGDFERAAQAEERAFDLSSQLAAAQLNTQYDDAVRGLKELTKNLADGPEFFGAEDETEPQQQPEDLYPYHPLAQAIQIGRDRLTEEQIAEFRETILQAERRQVPANARDRYRLAEQEGDVEGMARAAADEVLHMMYGQPSDGPPAPESSQPVQVGPQWQVRRLDAPPEGTGDE